MKKVNTALKNKYLLKLLLKNNVDLSKDVVKEKYKIQLLDELIKNKKALNEKLLMKDIYSLFPELKKLNINAHKEIAEEEIEDGAYFFIEELKERKTKT